MASTITQYSNLIDVNFPVPGEDNDSQGFRSNFGKIQSALTVAGREISAIQAGSVNLNTVNDFGENIIKRAALQISSQVVNDETGALLSDPIVSVDYALGSYQKYSVNGGSYTFTVKNWPSSGLSGAVRLEIIPSSSAKVDINFGSYGDLYVLSQNDLPVSYEQTVPIIWDLFSPDNGNTVYAYEVGVASAAVPVKLKTYFTTTLKAYTTSSINPPTHGTMVFFSDNTATSYGPAYFKKLPGDATGTWYVLTGTPITL